MKTVFTTGEAAKICKVSQQTIIRCFDNGQLKGFRVPGSRFRRIPREALYKFMKDNGIPTDALESGKRKVLLVDDDAELVELMTKVLEEDGRFEVRVATNGFDAGMMVKEYRPDLIVLDVMLPDINGKEVCHRVRADPTLEDVRILCISGMIEEDKIQELQAVRRRRLPAQAVRHRRADRPHVRPARDRAGVNHGVSREPGAKGKGSKVKGRSVLCWRPFTFALSPLPFFWEDDRGESPGTWGKPPRICPGCLPAPPRWWRWCDCLLLRPGRSCVPTREPCSWCVRQSSAAPVPSRFLFFSRPTQRSRRAGRRRSGNWTGPTPASRTGNSRRPDRSITPA